jgi:hypothetical protein
VIALVSAAAGLQAQDAAPEVVATLRLDGARTTFKMGQPVTLVMSFTGAANRYIVNPIVYGGTPAPDRYVFTPDDGVAKIYDPSYGPDYLTTREIGGVPVELRIALNDWFRFDKPGHYSLKIESSRVFLAGKGSDLKRTAPVTTNPVEFDITPLTAEEEAREIARLKAQDAGAARGAEAARVDAQKRLSYLTGDAAAREAVAAAFRGGANPPGLLRFPNRELVLRLLEEGYVQPGTFVRGSVLQEMADLHSPKDKAEELRILTGYLRRLSEALPSKEERPRILAAETILSLAKTNGLMESQGLTQPAIAVIRENFERVNLEAMLPRFWPQLRDPSLVPAIERILSNSKLQTRGHGQERSRALNALFDLAPERAKPFVVAELQNPEGIRDAALLGRSPDADLPELDQVLLSRIQSDRPKEGDTTVLARFASAAILPEIEKLYVSPPAGWNLANRMHVLAYLARRQGDAAMWLIGAEADKDLREHGTEANTLGAMASCYFPEVLIRLERQRLASDDAKAASWAAYDLSNHGTREDTALLEARLNRTPESERQLRRELTDALAKLRSRFPQ